MMMTRVIRWPLFLFLPVLLAVGVNAPALRAGYVWLDHGDLEQGAALAPGGEWFTLLLRPFGRTAFYRPLTAFSLCVDALWNRPDIFHGTQLLLHALVTLSVVAVARTLGVSRGVALLSGCLFGVHPVAAYVASGLPFRAELLMTGALALMMVAYARRHFVWAGVALLAAGLAKETGLFLGPLFVACWEASQPTNSAALGGTRPQPQTRWLALGGAWMGAMGLRWAVAPRWFANFPSLSVAEAVGTRLSLVTRSAQTLLWPFSMSPCDATPKVPPWSVSAVLGLLLGTILLGAAIRRRGAWLFFAVAFIPQLALFPAPRFWAVHTLYLPLFFGSILGAKALMRLRLGPWIAAVLIVLFGALAVDVSHRFRDDVSLFGPDASHRPECREGRLYLGDAALARGARSEAIRHYEAALARDERFISFADERAVLQNLGVAQLQSHNFVAAESHFRAALQRTTDPLLRRELTHNLAASALGRGDAKEAARLLETETERPDAWAASLLLRARALEMLGRYEEAQALRRRAPQ